MRRDVDLFKNMTTTDKVIVCCVKDEQPTTKQAEITKLLVDSIDWDNLIRQSGLHGVSSYLYHTLKEVDSGLVPPEVLQQLKKAYLVEFSRNIFFSSELSKILQELEKVRVKNMLLKGAFLDEKIYSQPGFRGYSDIDILVRKNDLPRAQNVLTKLGYKQISGNSKLSEREGRTQLHFQKSNSLVVDLHWEALNNKWYPNFSQYFEDNAWENAQTTNFNGSTIWTLHIEDLLIYQCIHLAVHHNFGKLIWFKDVDQVLRYSNKINWELFLAKVKQHRSATFCYYALCFAKTLFNSPVPERMLSELRPHFLTAKVFEFLVQRESLLETFRDRRGGVQQIWMVLRDDFYERLKAFRWRIFPSIEWYLHYYSFLPRAKEIYYYPLYPLLILLRLMSRPLNQRGEQRQEVNRGTD